MRAVLLVLLCLLLIAARTSSTSNTRAGGRTYLKDALATVENGISDLFRPGPAPAKAAIASAVTKREDSLADWPDLKQDDKYMHEEYLAVFRHEFLLSFREQREVERRFTAIWKMLLDAEALARADRRRRLASIEEKVDDGSLNSETARGLKGKVEKAYQLTQYYAYGALWRKAIADLCAKLPKSPADVLGSRFEPAISTEQARALMAKYRFDPARHGLPDDFWDAGTQAAGDEL